MPNLEASSRWKLLTQNPAAEQGLVDELGIPRLVARVLAARGMTDADEVEKFLTPTLERDWEDPLRIPGMQEVADRLERALDAGEKIAVFGDFDVDGMTSTCLLTLALRRMGATVDPYIPHRFGEGYGLSQAALARVMDGSSPDLVVTVDNGIAAAREVEWVLEQGVDVVVTDHHEPSDLVPSGIPVTDPKLSADCPSRDLAGAGVALKLVFELGRRRGMPDLWRDYIDVAALGTLSDMMNLAGENRALVAEGIERMHRVPRPGLAALAATAGVDLSQATADGLPFSVIPRLNAAGRMGTTDVALDLLLCEDPAEAAILAGRLEAVNNERRQTEAALTEEAMREVEATYRGGRIIVVGGEGWHEGVKGIVASRITNRFHVPAILFGISDGIARGSGRSVGSVDLFHAVEQCSDVLIRFGGHEGAVGVTCDADRLDEFRTRLEEVMDALPAEQFQDTGEVTATVGLSDLTVGSIAGLEMLQPFGQGNKKPMLAVEGVCMTGRARVGADGAHLRFSATDGRCQVPAIMFRVPEPERAAAWDGVCDLVFEAVNETWQGRTKPKLMVRDILIRDEAAGHAPCPEAADVAEDPAPEDGRAARSRLASLGEKDLTDALRRQMIGDSDLLPAQEQALARLSAGRSTLCVMATGRGKSLIFHLHAAREAILHGRASVFVFPLRALVTDQAYHLSQALAPVGVSVQTLTGESSEAERARVFGALDDGSADVILTTPEFLSIHSARFARSGRVGFLVIDEAHHAGQSKSGHRSAYAELPRIRAELGEPCCLAVTATAAPEVGREVCRLAGIAEDDVLTDESVRRNLAIDDARESRDRDCALVSIVSAAEKCVVYVSAREQAADVVRMLRHRVPELASRIAFYHAGLPRATRAQVERAFRADELSCIVSTSAFGEGVNLPGIRHVVLYSLPYGQVEFNQMSGRAGRDGAAAQVHVLFSSADVRANEQVLSSAAPAREGLVALYRVLMGRFRASGPVRMSDDELAAAARGVDAACPLTPAGVESGLAVFDELGFIDEEGFGEARSITMAPSPARMELESSVRYTEGLRVREAFEAFCGWALSAPADELLSHVRQPIVPGFGIIVGNERGVTHER